MKTAYWGKSVSLISSGMSTSYSSVGHFSKKILARREVHRVRDERTKERKKERKKERRNNKADHFYKEALC